MVPYFSLPRQALLRKWEGKTMKTPGFFAEASLGRGSINYLSVYLSNPNSLSSILPNQDGLQDGRIECVASCIAEFAECYAYARDEFDRCWCRNESRVCEWGCTGRNRPLEFCPLPDD